MALAIHKKQKTSITQSACGYIPADDTATNNTETIANMVIPAKVPVVVGEEGVCSGCGAVTLSVSYCDIGKIAGEMSYDILVNGANVTRLPEYKRAPTWVVCSRNLCWAPSFPRCDELGRLYITARWTLHELLWLLSQHFESVFTKE